MSPFDTLPEELVIKILYLACPEALVFATSWPSTLQGTQHSTYERYFKVIQDSFYLEKENARWRSEASPLMRVCHTWRRIVTRFVAQRNDQLRYASIGEAFLARDPSHRRISVFHPFENLQSPSSLTRNPLKRLEILTIHNYVPEATSIEEEEEEAQDLAPTTMFSEHYPGLKVLIIHSPDFYTKSSLITHFFCDTRFTSHLTILYLTQAFLTLSHPVFLPRLQVLGIHTDGPKWIGGEHWKVPRVQVLRIQWLHVQSASDQSSWLLDVFSRITVLEVAICGTTYRPWSILRPGATLPMIEEYRCSSPRDFALDMSQAGNGSLLKRVVFTAVPNTAFFPFIKIMLSLPDVRNVDIHVEQVVWGTHIPSRSKDEQKWIVEAVEASRNRGLRILDKRGVDLESVLV